MAQTAQFNFESLLAAIKKLPKTQKVKIWQTLDAELNRDEINREFARALEDIWTANEQYSEAEVNADVQSAIRQVREEQASHRS